MFHFSTIVILFHKSQNITNKINELCNLKKKLNLFFITNITFPILLILYFIFFICYYFSIILLTQININTNKFKKKLIYLKTETNQVLLKNKVDHARSAISWHSLSRFQNLFVSPKFLPFRFNSNHENNFLFSKVAGSQDKEVRREEGEHDHVYYLYSS